jgi:hypothetical protein
MNMTFKFQDAASPLFPDPGLQPDTNDSGMIFCDIGSPFDALWEGSNGSGKIKRSREINPKRLQTDIEERYQEKTQAPRSTPRRGRMGE